MAPEERGTRIQYVRRMGQQARVSKWGAHAPEYEIGRDGQVPHVPGSRETMYT